MDTPRKRVSADDVNLDAMAANCWTCHAGCSIAGQVAPAEGRSPRPRLDGPLAAFGNRDLPRDAIRQLSGLQSAEWALSLEQKRERFLGISDERPGVSCGNSGGR